MYLVETQRERERVREQDGEKVTESEQILTSPVCHTKEFGHFPTGSKETLKGKLGT